MPKLHHVCVHVSVAQDWAQPPRWEAEVQSQWCEMLNLSSCVLDLFNDDILYFSRSLGIRAAYGFSSVSLEHNISQCRRWIDSVCKYCTSMLSVVNAIGLPAVRKHHRVDGPVINCPLKKLVIDPVNQYWHEYHTLAMERQCLMEIEMCMTHSFLLVPPGLYPGSNEARNSSTSKSGSTLLIARTSGSSSIS